MTLGANAKHQQQQQRIAKVCRQKSQNLEIITSNCAFIGTKLCNEYLPPSNKNTSNVYNCKHKGNSSNSAIIGMVVVVCIRPNCQKAISSVSAIKVASAASNNIGGICFGAIVQWTNVMTKKTS